MKIVVAITAASGAIYARQLLEQLVVSSQVEKIALIYSTNAQAVVATEGVVMPQSDKIVRYDNDNLFAAPASGSARWDAMVIVPSSVGTMSRVACGLSQSLIERAADVMLKERRRLIIVPCCSLELCIQMGISSLFSFALCFSSFHSYL